MKRTNLVLDAKLLEETRKISSAKTYSDAVNTAMAEYVRRANMQAITEFFGKGLWDGDLTEMRGDNPRLSPKKTANGKLPVHKSANGRRKPSR